MGWDGMGDGMVGGYVGCKQLGLAVPLNSCNVTGTPYMYSLGKRGGASQWERGWALMHHVACETRAIPRFIKPIDDPGTAQVLCTNPIEPWGIYGVPVKQNHFRTEGLCEKRLNP
jgi:hypothetical protein